MTTATATYQVRLTPKEKTETIGVFNELGINPSQAVRLFFQQVRKTRSIPFPISYTPNAKTTKELLEPRSTGDYKRFDTVEALFADLNS